jgi:hypothetical protein
MDNRGGFKSSKRKFNVSKKKEQCIEEGAWNP